MLRFAAVIGVVEHNEGQYSLTETGRFLLRDVPGSLYMGIMLIGSAPWQRAWQNLEHALVTGEPGFDQALGAPFFDYLGQHPEHATPYHQWMTILTTMTARAITEAYDFAPFGSVCDIGGGQGILLKAILAANPHLRGILYDQESVLKDHVLADLAGRAEIQDGNFFDRVPAADALLMKSVLHDWSDDKCRIILGHCRRAMQPSARLLIVERVIASPADFVGSFYDLHMQVLVGGKERTEEEFGLLLQSAGLKLNRIISTAITHEHHRSVTMMLGATRLNPTFGAAASLNHWKAKPSRHYIPTRKDQTMLMTINRLAAVSTDASSQTAIAKYDTFPPQTLS